MIRRTKHVWTALRNVRCILSVSSR